MYNLYIYCVCTLTHSVFPAEREEAEKREYNFYGEESIVQCAVHELQQVVFTALSSKSERFISCAIFIE